MHILRSCNTTVYIFIKVSSSVLKMLHLVVILRDGQGDFYIYPQTTFVCEASGGGLLIVSLWY